MSLYAFELGRKKKLCSAELIHLLGENNLVEENLDTIIFQLEDLDDKDRQKLQDSLGGTIKIVKIIDTLPSSKSNLTKNLPQKIEKLLTETLKDHSGKIPFSISLLNFRNTRDINIKQLLNFSKKIIKSIGFNCRFVNKNFQNPKPAAIYKAKVIQKGIDICIIKGNEETFLGYSVSMQNIDNYSLRDYHKPGRDARVGMLPPKLAQIMINLAGPKTKTIYDPFCGTGTVPMEAMLMHKTAVGSDIEERLVKFSRENCTWLTEKFEKSGKNFRIFKKDAQKLTAKDLPEKIDAIITEGYLGKPVSKLPPENQRKAAFNSIARLHKAWLTAAHTITPENCKVVLCTTVFKNNGRAEYFPEFDRLVHEAGYRIVASFLYDRPDQIVARDIKVLEKL